MYQVMRATCSGPAPASASTATVLRSAWPTCPARSSCGNARAFPHEDLAGQVGQALRNTVAVLAEAGAGPEHVARMTWYITSRDEYLDNVKAIGAAYREVMGRHFPVMAVVE